MVPGLPVILTAFLAAACGTTLPLESYETASGLTSHATMAYFEAPRGDIWASIISVLQRREEDPELLDRQQGRITTSWKEAPSLIHFRRRVGIGGEESPVPLPSRYRLVVRVSRVDERTLVDVTADEQTNFLILAGTDPQTGKAYYSDRWERTATRTQREHRWLEDLREEVGRRLPGPTTVAGGLRNALIHCRIRHGVAAGRRAIRVPRRRRTSVDPLVPEPGAGRSDGLLEGQSRE